jgi:dihydrofolate reductase
MRAQATRRMIAALQVSLDGFIQGAEGEKDWADSWASGFGLIPDVDMFVLGARMYPDYGEYWKAILANPDAVPPFQERVPSPSEIAYARKAVQTPHVVLSTTLRTVSWPPTAQIVRSVAELRTLQGRPGQNAYVVGGATLVASLLNEDLIDELRLIVHPVVLGKGRGLFDGVNKRLSLDLVEAKPTEGGRVIVSYRTKRESKGGGASLPGLLVRQPIGKHGDGK